MNSSAQLSLSSVTGISLYSHDSLKIEMADIDGSDNNMTIILSSGTGDLQLINDGSGDIIIQSANNNVYITPDSTSYCYIAGRLRHIGSRVGFFDVTPISRQTATLLDTSATLSDVIIKINGMLNKLGYYGLFEVS